MVSRRIRERAEKLLAQGKVLVPPVPVFDLARLAGASVRVGPLPEDLSGFLLFQNGEALIGINGGHAATRQRFSVAHEIGHLLLHPQRDYIDRKFPVYFRDENSSKAEVKAEIEANQFAAELLMPKVMLEAILARHVDIDIEEQEIVGLLAKKFGVSAQALTFRLVNLGRIHQSALEKPPAYKNRKA